jgi:SPP1 gp7 family putative phage head morphogenesis protein
VPDKKKSKPRRPTAAELRRALEQRYTRGRKAEAQYRRQLVGVGKQVGSLIRGFAPGGVITNLEGLTAVLNRYAEILKPWARAITFNMHASVARRDLVTWEERGKEMSRALRKELLWAPTGEAMRAAMEEQVTLITSLPIEAAQRVHKIAREQILNSERYPELQKEIMRSGHVTESRARLIARTETARTASLLTESRARYVGSTHYIWHSVGDSDVRPRHRKLNGHVFAWDDPPVSGESGERSHPGQIYNCRCFAEPIIPDVLK